MSGARHSHASRALTAERCASKRRRTGSPGPSSPCCKPCSACSTAGSVGDCMTSPGGSCRQTKVQCEHGRAGMKVGVRGAAKHAEPHNGPPRRTAALKLSWRVRARPRLRSFCRAIALRRAPPLAAITLRCCGEFRPRSGTRGSAAHAGAARAKRAAQLRGCRQSQARVGHESHTLPRAAAAKPGL